MITCPICNQPMKPLISKTKPAASEHYCQSCHKSTPMKDLGEIQYYEALLAKGESN